MSKYIVTIFAALLSCTPAISLAQGVGQINGNGQSRGSMTSCPPGAFFRIRRTARPSQSATLRRGGTGGDVAELFEAVHVPFDEVARL